MCYLDFVDNQKVRDYLAAQSEYVDVYEQMMICLRSKKKSMKDKCEFLKYLSENVRDNDLEHYRAKYEGIVDPSFTESLSVMINTLSKVLDTVNNIKTYIEDHPLISRDHFYCFKNFAELLSHNTDGKFSDKEFNPVVDGLIKNTDIIILSSDSWTTSWTMDISELLFHEEYGLSDLFGNMRKDGVKGLALYFNLPYKRCDEVYINSMYLDARIGVFTSDPNEFIRYSIEDYRNNKIPYNNIFFKNGYMYVNMVTLGLDYDEENEEESICIDTWRSEPLNFKELDFEKDDFIAHNMDWKAMMMIGKLIADYEDPQEALHMISHIRFRNDYYGCNFAHIV